MKKKFIILTLLLVATNIFGWNKEIYENEDGEEVISYTKKISNYKLTYNLVETSEVEYLRIEDNLYIYTVVKGKDNNDVVLFYNKYKSNYDRINLNNSDIINEIRALKIRDKLLKYKDDVSRNIIYLLDEMK